MIEDLAVNYFRNMPKEERQVLLRKIFDSLSNQEKLEIARIIIKDK